VKKCNVNVRCTTYDDVSPLIMAACWNQPAIAKFLIEEGARLRYKIRGGESSAVVWACSMDNFEVFKILVEAGSDISTLGQPQDPRCTPYKYPERCRKFVHNFRFGRLMVPFLLGFHKRVGNHSSIQSYLCCSSIFERALLRCVFEMCV